MRIVSRHLRPITGSLFGVVMTALWRRRLPLYRRRSSLTGVSSPGSGDALAARHTAARHDTAQHTALGGGRCIIHIHTNKQKSTHMYAYTNTCDPHTHTLPHTLLKCTSTHAHSDTHRESKWREAQMAQDHPPVGEVLPLRALPCQSACGPSRPRALPSPPQQAAGSRLGLPPLPWPPHKAAPTKSPTRDWLCHPPVRCPACSVHATLLTQAHAMLHLI